MLSPKRVKYRKSQRGKRKGLSVNASTVCFGNFGIKALEPGYLWANQIETTRVILTRRLRRGGKLWIRVFPDKPVTKKAAESRLGKGKGEVEGWVSVIKRGRIIFEIGGVPEDYARQSFRLVSHKFPFKSMFVTRRH